MPFRFSAAFDGLPPSPGTVLQDSGPDVLNVLDDGQVVARTSSRIITPTAVPEPGSLVLSGLGSAAMLAIRGARRARSAPSA